MDLLRIFGFESGFDTLEEGDIMSDSSIKDQVSEMRESLFEINWVDQPDEEGDDFAYLK